MAFGPHERLEAGVRSAARMAGQGILVSRAGEALHVGLEGAPGQGFEVTVAGERLGCRIELRPAQFGGEFAAELRDLLNDHTTFEAIRDLVGTGGQLMVDAEVPSVVVELVPSATSALMDDVERAQEVVLAVLAVATEPYVLESGGDDVATIRTLTGARPSILRPLESLETSTFEYDPAVRDESTREHRSTENALIGVLRDAGLAPHDGPAGLPFDVGWVSADGVPVLAEIKSTAATEVEQVRLGLGQVLEYSYRAEQMTGTAWTPLLVTSRPLEEAFRRNVATRAGVHLVDGAPLERVLKVGIEGDQA